MGGVQGKRFVKGLPEELKESSPGQLQTLIDTAIANNPWNEDPSASFDQRLKNTIRSMKQKGFRPINTDEYREQLRLASKKDSSAQIKLWRPIEGFVHVSTSSGQIFAPPSPSSTGELAVCIEILPVSKEELTEELGASMISSDDERLDTSESQLDTEEWPMAYAVRAGH